MTKLRAGPRSLLENEMDNERNPLATVQDAAKYLSIKVWGLYAPSGDLAHLRRLQMGERNTRYYWAQIEAHREQVIRAGRCTGECESVFAELDKPVVTPMLRAVKSR